MKGDASFRPRRDWPARALVIVLGDLGRSPRMVQHCLALAASGTRVTLGGYLETELDVRVRRSSLIEIGELRAGPAAPREAGRLAFLLQTLRRVLELHWRLGRLLLRKAPPGGVVLVQNPPSLPTLWLAAWVSRRRSARFVVDWHNFGYSLLGLRLGERSRLVDWARRYELWAGRKADGAFCVSQAMQNELARHGVRPPPVVVYDRPLDYEAPLDGAARRRLLAELLPDAPQADVFLVCPTSWTADEDTDLLLEALRLREKAADRVLPRLFVLLTGMGPARARFEERLAEMRPAFAEVRTHFFSPEDYRRVLRAADLGLSLHRSASGVDLPMKIIDFYGAGTPVLALDYGPCLAEQVRDGVDGRTFRSAEELAALLTDGVSPSETERFRQARRENQQTWTDEIGAAWTELDRRWGRERG